jgi:hypothetical protein
MKKIHNIWLDQINTFDYDQKKHLTPIEIDEIASYDETQRELFEHLNRLDNIRLVLKQVLKKVPVEVKTVINDHYNTPEKKSDVFIARKKLAEIAAWNYSENNMDIDLTKYNIWEVCYKDILEEELAAKYLHEIIEGNNIQLKEMIAANIILNLLNTPKNKTNRTLFADTLIDTLAMEAIINMDEKTKHRMKISEFSEQHSGKSPYEMVSGNDHWTLTLEKIHDKYDTILKWEEIYGTMIWE